MIAVRRAKNDPAAEEFRALFCGTDARNAAQALVFVVPERFGPGRTLVIGFAVAAGTRASRDYETLLG